jgi:hypothetical protein
VADPDYFTLAELRALPDCGSTTFTDAQINAAATYFTAIVEREIGYPLIPRTFTDVLDGGGFWGLVLSQAYVRSLTTVEVDGASVSTALLTVSGGVLRYLDGSAWSDDIANVEVVYSAGRYATCPGDIKNACLWATRDRLLSQSDSSGIDVRKTSVNTDFGTTNYILPGEKRPTGYPDLDAAIAGYVRTSVSFGFA